MSGFQKRDDYFHFKFEDQRDRPFTWLQSGLIVGSLSLGALIGALASAPLANLKLGRMNTVMCCSVTIFIGTCVQFMALFARDSNLFMAGRIVLGLGIGGISVLVPTYIGEISPTPIRGSVVYCYQLFIALGIWVANILNYTTEDSWIWIMSIGIFLFMIFYFTVGLWYVYCVTSGYPHY
jgi:SP family sugar:H+ symporter-like MFS transporter